MSSFYTFFEPTHTHERILREEMHALLFFPFFVCLSVVVRW